MSTTQLRSRSGLDAVTARWVPPTLLVIAGLLWLTSVNWKVPPDFGDTARGCSGLCGFVEDGIEHPVAPRTRWVLDTVVQPQLTAFGWLVLVTEVALAALLLSGRHLRVAAVLGATQSLAIGLTVANAPDEWYWSYVLMIAVHLAVLGFAPVLRPTPPAVMAALVAIYGVVVSIAHAEGGFGGDGNDTWTLFTGGNDVPDEFGRATFPGSIALGLVLVAVAAGAWALTKADPRTRTVAGWALVAVAAGLLATYGTDGLALRLGSRAVTAAVLATLGLTLTTPQPADAVNTGHRRAPAPTATAGTG
jgi:hypothetical protein